MIAGAVAIGAAGVVMVRYKKRMRNYNRQIDAAALAGVPLHAGLTSSCANAPRTTNEAEMSDVHASRRP